MTIQESNSTLFDSTQHIIFYKFIWSDQRLVLDILTQIPSKSKHQKKKKNNYNAILAKLYLICLLYE